MWTYQFNDYAVLVRGGSEYFDLGRTTFRATQEGDITVENILGKQRSAFDGKRNLLGLFNALVDGEVWELQVGERLGVPDEVRYRMELLRQDRVERELEFWDGEFGEHEELRLIMERLRALVAGLSDGQVVL